MKLILVLILLQLHSCIANFIIEKQFNELDCKANSSYEMRLNMQECHCYREYCPMDGSLICSLNKSPVQSFRVSGDEQTLVFSYYEDTECTSFLMTSKAFILSPDKCRNRKITINIAAGSLPNRNNQTCGAFTDIGHVIPPMQINSATTKYGFIGLGFVLYFLL